MRHPLLVAALIACGVAAPGVRTSAVQQKPDANSQLERAILKELIEINTTDSSGDVTKASEAVAVRLRGAGFAASDVQVVGPSPKKRNLVARLRGTGRAKPILLIAHLDVVEARRSDWSFDPFVFREQDGYFYGRGTSDIKDGVAALVAMLIRLKQEKFVPDRDVIVALTADEETGSANGVDWLLRNRRELIDADYCLNVDGGGGEIKNGVKLANELQTSEKVYLNFTLETRNPGGHSSLPVRDNAIYRLAAGLTRLASYRFPVRLNETTRAFFDRMAATEAPDVAKDMKAVAATPPDLAAAERLAEASPYYNALMRTTCVATRLEAGHADNALPQLARALVNCRLLPDDSPQEVQQTLVHVIADAGIQLTPGNEPRPSPPSPLRPDVVQAVERITSEMWPGVPVVPVMSTGATDGLTLRRAGMPVYGVSGIFEDVDDVRAHGKDERIGVTEFYEGAEFMYRLVKALGTQQQDRHPGVSAPGA
jgi:acetylornithine deacetylase/succinyl-diaminopimelate desuccinylase-like protein